MVETDTDHRNNATLLTMDAGTSTLRFGLFTADGRLRQLCAGIVEGIGSMQGRIHASDIRNGTLFDEARTIEGFRTAFKYILELLESYVLGSRPVAIGHRVIYGGGIFKFSVVLDKHVVGELKRMVPYSPLDLPNNIAAIVAARAVRPKLIQIACFDTAFHEKRPEIATLTGLNGEEKEDRLRRNGRHGLAFEHAVDTLYRNGAPVSRERIILAHLGANASMCALKNGVSVETATNFSALSGLRLGMYCGDLDRQTMLYLLSRNGSNPSQIKSLISKADEAPDTLHLAQATNSLLDRLNGPSEVKAVELFCYQAKKQLVGLTATLGGLDRLVFTGSVGVDAPLVRAKICEGLGYLDIVVDSTRNLMGDRTISSPARNVTINVIKADEGVTIARHVRRILNSPTPFANVPKTG